MADKSGNHFVTNYTSCVYNNGDHGELSATGPCVGKCNDCGATVVYHNDDKNLLTTVIYSNYGEVGTKTIVCQNDGCTYNATEEAPALFTCLDYSAPEGEKLGIAIGYKVNKDAIKEYEEATGKTFEYGVFAVSKTKLGENSIFDNEGNATSGVISTELSSYDFSSVLLKITGFEEKHKTMEFALGVYTSFDGNYGYIQENSTVVNDAYIFTSYNAIIDGINKQKEVA